MLKQIKERVNFEISKLTPMEILKIDLKEYRIVLTNNFIKLRNEKNNTLSKILNINNKEANNLINQEEYFVFTKNEKEEKLEEVIKESLCYFNYSFLANYTNLPEKVFEGLAKLYEDSNDTIYILITKEKPFSDFIEECEKSDGAGHFLSHYDGNEIEKDEFFIYRQH